MKNLRTLVVRCVACIELLIIQNKAAREASKISDAEIEAFNQTIETIHFLAVRM